MSYQLPNKEGFYWYKNRDAKRWRIGHITMGYLNGKPYGLTVNFIGDNESYLLENCRWKWIGPIEEPKMTINEFIDFVGESNGEQKSDKKFIGLMGVKSDGRLVTPSGKPLFKLPLRLAAFVQRMQHRVAKRSWRL